MSLGYLHQLTTAIGKYFLDSSSSLSQTQHAAVHFCLAFFIISEFEFYRVYINLKKYESSLDALKYFRRANITSERVFPVSRDPWVFGYIRRIETPDAEVTMKSAAMHIGQYLLFWIVGGLANYPLKRIIDPSSSHWKDLLCATTGINVFFTTEDALTLFLHLSLLRVMRKANHVGFWAVVGVVEWWKAGAEDHSESVVCWKVGRTRKGYKIGVTK